ncbi:hypothetical protein HXZ77_02070 [Acinetobacter johnsonii]|uniref:hypothetical protein n=1 Tax=Acinetobacter johnsonii TaxID=40214 RepID=UPI0025790CA1|nr:hypothetical protein [Acinetobacter johnsonii]MDM1249941.1 hypothetical protein [Acinetobacter johnsonii]
MKFFFNELSLQDLDNFSQISEAYKRLKYVKDALELGDLPDLIFYKNILYFKIKDNKILADILVGSKVNDQELQEYLLYQISNAPFLDEFEDNDELLSLEYKYKEKECYGFAIAHQEILKTEKDHKVASFSSHNEWECFNISVNFTTDGNLQDYPINHLGDTKTTANLEQSWLWREIQKRLEVIDTESLILNIQRLAYISLSDRAIDDIRSRGQDLIFINKINDFLSKINSFCIESWQENKDINWSLLMKKKAIRVRPESEGTLKNYASERIEKNEKGENEVFSLHLDVRGTAEKMYLKTVNESRKVFVGFITTKHLTTMNH